MMKKLTLLMMLFAVLSLSACSNTLEGMGKDIQEMGKSIEDAGDK